jgi:Putative Flp pilus-assembly TadE/G-like
MNNLQSNKFFHNAKQIWRNKNFTQQRGAVAIFVALSMTVMIGFAGLAIDMGRLYVHKSELQNAVDACALAAAKELICDTSVTTGVCPKTFVENAEIAGRFIASKNKGNFQGTAIAIGSAGAIDNGVTFSTSLAGSYAAKSASDYAPINFPKFARCSAKATGITPWFMGMVGIGDQVMKATAVGTLSPSQGFCNGPPMGVCNKAGGAPPNFGYTKGEWIVASFNDGGGPPPPGCSGPPAARPETCFADAGLTGSFRWVDFTPPADGTNEIRDQLIGDGATCGISVSNNVVERGVKQGAKLAYNTRFGVYPNSGKYTKQTAAPDFTGYAYPTNAIPQTVGPAYANSAYIDYRARQKTHDSFSNTAYKGTGTIKGTISSPTELAEFGVERRLVGIPVIQCAGTGNTTPIIGVACVLMLNPMSNGANGDIYLEYRGNATAIGSPCATTGLASNGSGKGPLVPTLVQ